MRIRTCVILKNMVSLQLEVILMKKVTIELEDFLYQFYQKVGETAGGISVEQVLSDSLFKLAGELSLEALHKTQTEE